MDSDNLFFYIFHFIGTWSSISAMILAWMAVYRPLSYYKFLEILEGHRVAGDEYIPPPAYHPIRAWRIGFYASGWVGLFYLSYGIVSHVISWWPNDKFGRMYFFGLASFFFFVGLSGWMATILDGMAKLKKLESDIEAKILIYNENLERPGERQESLLAKKQREHDAPLLASGRLIVAPPPDGAKKITASFISRKRTD
ncbi:MAG: hypothetical protein ACXW4B_10080 [Micavibrio sp.]